VVLFLVIFFWTPAHYWPLSVKYGEDYRRVDVPMLGAVRTIEHVAGRVTAYAVATVLASVFLIPVAGMNWLYSAVALAGGGWFAGEAFHFQVAARRAEGSPRPMRMFAASNAYLALLFAAAAVDPLLSL
jgi:protoheme IX farnesyltransferase